MSFSTSGMNDHKTPPVAERASNYLTRGRWYAAHDRTRSYPSPPPDPRRGTSPVPHHRNARWFTPPEKTPGPGRYKVKSTSEAQASSSLYGGSLHTQRRAGRTIPPGQTKQAGAAELVYDEGAGGAPLPSGHYYLYSGYLPQDCHGAQQHPMPNFDSNTTGGGGNNLLDPIDWAEQVDNGGSSMPWNTPR